MKFHGIKMLGKLFAKAVGSTPWDASYTSAIVYDDDTGALVYGDPNTSSFKVLNDIPSGSVFLFDSDVSISGYSILGNIDDAVVYITVGSDAGGQAGGSMYSGGSFSMNSHDHTLNSHTHGIPNHYHTMQNHTHTGASHRHQWVDFQAVNYVYSYTAAGSLIRAQDYGTSDGVGQAVNEDGQDAWTLAGDFWTNMEIGGSTLVANTDNTGYAATGGLAANNASTGLTTGTSLVWKPKGRNFTRQQRH